MAFVAYNGKVYELFNDGTTKAMEWIRFEVHPTENTKKVKSIIQALRPHLEKEGYKKIIKEWFRIMEDGSKSMM